VLRGIRRCPDQPVLEVELLRKFCLVFSLFWVLPVISLCEDNPDMWHEKSETDPVTDSRKVYMFRIADHEILSLGNLVSQSWPRIVIGCENRHNFFAFQINKPPMTSQNSKVSATTRFGSFKPVTTDWDSRAGGAMLVMPDKADPINFAAGLTLVDKVFLRYTPKQGPDVTLEFTVTGVKNHLPNIARACGWDYAKAVREVQ